jgi:hypothetical protein
LRGQQCDVETAARAASAIEINRPDVADKFPVEINTATGIAGINHESGIGQPSDAIFQMKVPRLSSVTSFTVEPLARCFVQTIFTAAGVESNAGADETGTGTARPMMTRKTSAAHDLCAVFDDGEDGALTNKPAIREVIRYPHVRSSEK